MAQLTRLLERRPPTETSRYLCLELLQEARTALGRLNASDDDEALHDFRVALRRLRSLIRAYGRHLGASVSKKIRNDLKQLAASTNPARDYEVLVEHFRSNARYDDSFLRPGVDYVVDRLEAPAALDRQRLALEFRAVERRLTKNLVRYKARLTMGESVDFRQATAKRIRRSTRELFVKMEHAQSVERADAIHESRICAKRLRYLLEPWRPLHEIAQTLVDELKKLQDLLGNLQDSRVRLESVASCLERAAVDEARRAHRLALSGEPTPTEASPDPAELATSKFTPALMALIQTIRVDRESQFSDFTEWAGANCSALRADLKEFTRQLQRRPSIKPRRYLLRDLPDLVLNVKPERCEEGYLPGHGFLERLVKHRRGRWVSYEREISSAKLQLEEANTEIPSREFRALWPLTEGRRLEWDIYSIEEPGGWTIRQLRSRPLVLAEYRGEEAPSTEWLSDWLREEVTDDPKYESAVLAKAKRATTTTDSGHSRPGRK